MEESGIKLNADAADAFIRSMNDAADSLKNFSRAGEAAADVNFKPKVDLDPAKKSVEDFDGTLKKTADNAGGHMDRMQAVVAGAAAAISNALINAAADIARAGVDFVKGGVEAAADLETKLAILNATAETSPKKLEEVRKKVVALGADMSLPGTNATDATNAILELVKGGLSLDDAMDAARSTLMLATAAEVDTGEAAKITAGILNAFGLSGKDAQVVIDQLAAAAAAGAGDISDYSMGFQQAGFAFKLTKQDTGDLATALQVLIESGLGGSDAGTALKNAMMRLINPTDAARDTMAALGISVYDANGQMKPFPELIDVFNKATEGMTDEQRNAALGTIFLSDGLKAMAPILDQGRQKFEDRKKAVEESGKTEALASAQMQGFNGAMEGLRNVVDTLALTIGGALLPALTTLIKEHVAPAVEDILKFATAFSTAGESVGGMARFFQPVTDAVEMLMDKFPILRTVVENVMATIQSITANVLPFIAEFWLKHGDEIMGIVNEVFGTIQRIIELVLTFINKYVITALKDTADNFNKYHDQIMKIVEGAWNIIKGIFTVVLGLINGIVNVAMALMEGNLDKALNAIKEMFSNIWDGIKTALDGVLQVIVGIIDSWLKQAGTSVDTELKKIQKFFDDAWKSIQKAVDDAGKAIYASIIKPIDDAIKYLNDAGAKFDQAGRDMINGIVNGINAIGDNIKNAITKFVDDAVQSALTAIGNIKSAIENIFKLIDRAKQLVGGIFGGGGGGGNSGLGFKGTSVTTTYNTNNSYNLSLATSTSPGVVVQSFEVMKAFA